MNQKKINKLVIIALTFSVLGIAAAYTFPSGNGSGNGSNFSLNLQSNPNLTVNATLNCGTNMSCSQVGTTINLDAVVINGINGTNGTTNHNALTNLTWSTTGHTIDTFLYMNNKNISDVDNIYINGDILGLNNLSALGTINSLELKAWDIESYQNITTDNLLYTGNITVSTNGNGIISNVFGSLISYLLLSPAEIKIKSGIETTINSGLSMLLQINNNTKISINDTHTDVKNILKINSVGDVSTAITSLQANDSTWNHVPYPRYNFTDLSSSRTFNVNYYNNNSYPIYLNAEIYVLGASSCEVLISVNNVRLISANSGTNSDFDVKSFDYIISPYGYYTFTKTSIPGCTEAIYKVYEHPYY